MSTPRENSDRIDPMEVAFLRLCRRFDRAARDDMKETMETVLAGTPIDEAFVLFWVKRGMSETEARAAVTRAIAAPEGHGAGFSTDRRGRRARGGLQNGEATAAALPKESQP